MYLNTVCCCAPLSSHSTALISWLFLFFKRRLLFYALLTVHRSVIFVNRPTWCTNFSCMFVSILYMFRATICPSSGELTVSMQYLVCVTRVTLCGRPSGMCHSCHSLWTTVWYAGSNLHARQSSTQSDIYQVSHWYS